MDNKTEAILAQQVEFLQIQLDESLAKERTLKQSYDQLLWTLKPVDIPQEASEVLTEIQKIHAKYAEEISELKAQHIRDTTDYIQQIKQLQKENDGLKGITSRHSTNLDERDKNLSLKEEELEMERWGLSQKLQSKEDELKKKCVANKNKYQLKLKEVTKEIEISREEGRKEAIQVQTEAYKEIANLKQMYHREHLNLKAQLGSSPRGHQEPETREVPEARETPDTRKSTESRDTPALRSYHTTDDSDFTDMLHKSDILDIIDYNLGPLMTKARSSSRAATHTARSSIEPCMRCMQYMVKLKELSEVLAKAKTVIDGLKISKEKTHTDFETAQIQIRQLEMALSRKSKDYMNREISMKNEIRFLTGKVLYEKGKFNLDSPLLAGHDGSVIETERMYRSPGKKDHRRLRSSMSPIRRAKEFDSSWDDFSWHDYK